MMAEEVENCVVEEKAKPFNEELEDIIDTKELYDIMGSRPHS